MTMKCKAPEQACRTPLQLSDEPLSSPAPLPRTSMIPLVGFEIKMGFR